MDSLLQLTGFFSPWQRYFTFSDWYQNVNFFLSDWHHTGFSMVNAGYPGKPMEA